MDEERPQVEGENKGWLKALAFLEIGGFELIFVLVVLVLFFGTLNYFNILSLSTLYPNYFGLLPHRPLQQTLPNSQQTPTPTISLENEAKTILASFLPKILVPELVPSILNITLRQEKVVKENFVLLWDTKEGTANARLTISPDGKKISSFNILFFKSQTASPSVELAQTIIPSVFSLEPEGQWGCKPVYNQTYCENFWEDKEGIRKGVNITGPFPENKQKIGLIVSFCEHTKEAKTLYSWKSCTSEFAKTGVR